MSHQNPIRFSLLPPPDILKDDVECIRVAEYTGDEALAIKVCLNGRPGLVFQHYNGHSPIESITTPSRHTCAIPTLYLYGQITESSVMQHKPGPYTMTQVILKPHALRTLFGLNAAALTNQTVELGELSAGHLHDQLLNSDNHRQHIALITHFLLAQCDQANTRDTLVEESLALIHNNIGCVTVKHLIDHLHISQRQFERRFSQSVGVSPQFYIRVRRFNEAIRLIKSRPFARMTDIAHGLNFHDQSHFIRDVKALSGITPKTLLQKQGGFLHGLAGYAYL